MNTPDRKRLHLLGTLALCAAVGPRVHAAAAGKPRVEVHKSPTCGCCGAWVDHLREAGFDVAVHESDDLDPLKDRLGVPARLRSCHVAQVGGYFIEGHVPAADVKRLLQQRPSARGLVVPGMPLGSPGMEVAGARPMGYEVLLVPLQGEPTVYARYKG